MAMVRTVVTVIVMSTVTVVTMMLLVKNLGLLKRMTFAGHTSEECSSSKKVERLHRGWL